MLTKGREFDIIIIGEVLFMKRDYQKELDLLLTKLDEKSKPKLLLHSCCGPCSSYVLEYLSKYFDVTVYYFNPNIFPKEEYEKRLKNQLHLIEKSGWAKFLPSDYNYDEFLSAATGLEGEKEGGLRCTECFRLRLTKTAQAAKNGGFDYFATTLSVSPHKNAQLLGQLGEEIGEQYGIKHLPSDFKKREGYKRSIELARQFDLYRQDYCGCEFSIRE